MRTTAIVTFCCLSEVHSLNLGGPSWHLRSTTAVTRARVYNVVEEKTTSRAAIFDDLLLKGKVDEAAALLKESDDVKLDPSRVVSAIDAACNIQVSNPVARPSILDFAAQAVQTPEEEQSAVREAKRQQEQLAAEVERVQQTLLNTYEALAARGALRGFGSVETSPIAAKIISPADQLALTGLPMSAFAPGGGNGGLIAGAAAALFLASASANLNIDYGLVGGVVGLALVADRLALGGVGIEVLARTVNPNYQKTVIKHEAGHFLVAYLLGCPIEACLLDPLAAARDARFPGAAGTVFFDPNLASAMRKGVLPRSLVDKYSVIVMAGIAAEAEANGRAEGGRADEEALLRLLASLDRGSSWDLGRARNQARWAASSAVLLIRAHRDSYNALCDRLASGASIGKCIAAIEANLPPTPPFKAVQSGNVAGIAAGAEALAAAPASQQVASPAGAAVPTAGVSAEAAAAAVAAKRGRVETAERSEAAVLERKQQVQQELEAIQRRLAENAEKVQRLQ
mmetsp:Transcript_29767/g.57451  ORF Transcript_29767/g.57451 Transcript_29767/m.57451 type:complete len:513 (-) Transcript_29767:249-1787(-)